MYHAERLGGGLSLCAMRIPAEQFERVAEQVNAFPEVAHNYARDHAFNMWFVLATETPARIDAVLEEIERRTGFRVYNMPKLREFFIGLKFEV
jgi:DNA-binding Lrp family transcriptional regulator